MRSTVPGSTPAASTTSQDPTSVVGSSVAAREVSGEGVVDAAGAVVDPQAASSAAEHTSTVAWNLMAPMLLRRDEAHTGSG